MLTKQEHLTVSFDGWSSRRNDEVYTAHIILPDRRVFFVEGFVMNGISCTGEVLRDRLTEVSYFHSFLTLFVANVFVFDLFRRLPNLVLKIFQLLFLILLATLKRLVDLSQKNTNGY